MGLPSDFERYVRELDIGACHSAIYNIGWMSDEATFHIDWAVSHSRRGEAEEYLREWEDKPDTPLMVYINGRGLRGVVFLPLYPGGHLEAWREINEIITRVDEELRRTKMDERIKYLIDTFGVVGAIQHLAECMLKNDNYDQFGIVDRKCEDNVREILELLDHLET